MRLRTCIVLIAVLAGGAGALSGGSAYAQEGGTIRGVVFHDLDGDGVSDAGEPGLSTREVVVDGGGREVTNADGSYSAEVGVGEHTASVELDQGAGVCTTIFFSFHPLSRAYCINVTHPWHATTPQSVTVTLVDGGVEEIDFGLEPFDVATVAGIAVLEDDIAPPGTAIEALVDGQECGTTTATAADLTFQIDVLGEGERSGCGTRGSIVHFRVGGVPAVETVTWVPFTETPTFGGFISTSLVAMQDHAWYWWQRTGDYARYDGAKVEALVDGEVCGETTLGIGGGIEGSPANIRIAGFSKLIVPSEALQPGCGRAGAIVTFRVGGVVLATMPWLPGLQEITSDLPRVLPNDGSGGAEAGRGPTAGIIVALALVGLLALCGAGLVARRR